MTEICTILGYHEIAPVEPNMRQSLMVSPRTFATHLTYLRALGARCVTLEDVGRALHGEISLPRRSFAITFDDGYVGIYRYARPILQRFGYPATVFVPSTLVGQQATPGDQPPVAKMNASQLRELPAMNIAIGSHTRTHVDVTKLSTAELQEEIVDSRRELEDLLGQPVSTFSFPFGRRDAASVAAVREASYQLACTTQYGRVRAGASLHELPRVLIGENLPLPSFTWRLWRSRHHAQEEIAR